MESKIFKVKNEISQLAVIVEMIEEIAEQWKLSDETKFNLNLALEEIFTNIVFYAFNDQHEHIIILSFTLQEGNIKIEIEDDGKEFNPLDNPEPEHIDKPLEEREIGGLGIHFVKTVMDRVEYRRDKNKNILILTISNKQ